MSYLMVAIGSALGGMLRYWLSSELFNIAQGQFPWPTLTVNAMGSALIGVLAGIASEPGRVSADLQLFLAIGVFGGFTTFSTFSLQVVDLIEAGRLVTAGAYMAGSIGLCVGFAALGYGLAK